MKDLLIKLHEMKEPVRMARMIMSNHMSLFGDLRYCSEQIEVRVDELNKKVITEEQFLKDMKPLFLNENSAFARLCSNSNFRFSSVYPLYTKLYHEVVEILSAPEPKKKKKTNE